jgi:hypothetical protein
MRPPPICTFLSRNHLTAARFKSMRRFASEEIAKLHKAVAQICAPLLILAQVVSSPAQSINQNCSECKKSCADARIQVKAFCCKSSGGKYDGVYVCASVKDNTNYVICLKGGERDEIACWNECEATVCR